MAKTVKLTVNTLLIVYHIADRLLQHFFFFWFYMLLLS